MEIASKVDMIANLRIISSRQTTLLDFFDFYFNNVLIIMLIANGNNYYGSIIIVKTSEKRPTSLSTRAKDLVTIQRFYCIYNYSYM